MLKYLIHPGVMIAISILLFIYALTSGQLFIWVVAITLAAIIVLVGYVYVLLMYEAWWHKQFKKDKK